MTSKPSERNPWSWVPSLYFAEGIPYIIVTYVSVVMYKGLGISNADIALYTSWLYLPWVIKPIWSPVVDLLKTKRLWVILMQLLIGAGLAGIAFTIPAGNFFRYSLMFFWLLAFSSATHDIAADGFYMLGLSVHNQAKFVGIRSTFYRLSMIFGQGVLVIIAGKLQQAYGTIYSWNTTLYIVAALYFLFFVYHFFILPHPKSDKPAARTDTFWKDFFATFVLFFKKKNIGAILAFILLYRFGEAQLLKLASPFLLDKTAAGGLGLNLEQVGFIYGTVGVIALMIGGILGGLAASRDGLKYWIWWMVAAINIPDLVYVYMSFTHPSSLIIINACVMIEQLGYGFGFTAFMLVLIYFSQGEHKTAHYAIATGLMALGMMLPGMISGWLQEHLGYPVFFIWVCISTIPGFIVTKFIKIDTEFGKKEKKTE